MIIDAHNHADWHKHGFQAFAKNMDECHIDKTWLLTWETPDTERNLSDLSVLGNPALHGSTGGVPASLAQGVSYRDRLPGRFILGYAPDPRRGGALLNLKAAMDLYGIQVCGEVKFRMMYDNYDAIEMFHFCADAGLPVTLHFDYPAANPSNMQYPFRNWWYGGSVDTLERVLQACPDTVFLGHAPGFWAHISGDDCGLTKAYPRGPVLPGGRIEYLLEHYPNLYCDMSAGSARIALSRDPEYSEKLINRFPERFVYARDNFDNELQGFIAQLNLSEDVEELLYHKNAERIVRKL